MQRIVVISYLRFGPIFRGEKVVPKRGYEVSTIRCVIAQNRAVLNFVRKFPPEFHENPTKDLATFNIPGYS